MDEAKRRRSRQGYDSKYVVTRIPRELIEKVAGQAGVLRTSRKELIEAAVAEVADMSEDQLWEWWRRIAPSKAGDRG